MVKNIYFDHNASTPIDPLVAEVICSYLKEKMGNPSSIHQIGQKAKKHLNEARQVLSDYLKVRPEEIIFTSGGTEAINMVIRGLFEEKSEGHILTSIVEHAAVFKTVKEMEKKGVKASYLEPGSWGAIRPAAIKEALRPDTKLITLMAVNNETGVKTDIKKIAEIAYEAKVPFLVDGVALLGREHIEIPEGVSAMAFSGQKIHATPGVGFCFLRKNLTLSPLLTGGAQQYGRRGGTENLPGIVGLKEAVKILAEVLPEAGESMRRLRDYFEEELKKRIPGLLINGEGPRVCNVSNLSFPEIEGETLLMALDLEGVAASHGSACASGSLEPSRILVNMGLAKERVRSSIRFSFSRMTTQEEVQEAIEIIVSLFNRLK